MPVLCRARHLLSHRAALAATTLALIVANGWIAAHRMQGYNYRFASLASIYEPLDGPTIEQVSWRAPDRLEVELSGTDPADDWQVLRSPAPATPTAPEAGFPLEPVPGGGARVTLHGEPATYALVAPGGDPRATRTFRVHPRDGLLMTSDLLVGPSPGRVRLCELTYSPDRYPPADVERVRALLRRAGVRASETTETKLRKVWLLTFAAVDPHRGTPPPWLHRLPVFAQYERLTAGEVRSHCNTFARVFALFATVAGIPTRVVDTNREVNGVRLSAHTFAEVYLPELGRWAFTDVTLNVLSVRDAASGRTLSAVQLSHAIAAGATGGLLATVMRDGALEDVPFSELSDVVPAYLNDNATFVYHRQYADRGSAVAWLHRYLVAPEPAYSLHAEDNRLHWTKMACFYLLALHGAIWLGLLGRWVVRRRVHRADGATPALA